MNEYDVLSRHIRGLGEQLALSEQGGKEAPAPYICQAEKEFRTRRKASTGLMLEVFLGPTGGANFYYGDTLGGVTHALPRSQTRDALLMHHLTHYLPARCLIRCLT